MILVDGIDSLKTKVFYHNVVKVNFPVGDINYPFKHRGVANFDNVLSGTRSEVFRIGTFLGLFLFVIMMLIVIGIIRRGNAL
jgi:hypothetical protein